MRNMMLIDIALGPEPHRPNHDNWWRRDQACRRCGQPWPCMAARLEVVSGPEVDA